MAAKKFAITLEDGTRHIVTVEEVNESVEEPTPNDDSKEAKDPTE